MGERESLLRAVCANPDDDTPRLVFADWLQENGDPDLAEFIRVQVELSGPVSDDRRKELEAREKALLKAHKREWTKPFREFGGSRTEDPCEFRRGFVEDFSADAEAMAEDGGKLFELAPVRDLAFADAEEYDDLAKCKWLRKLRSLDLTGSGLSHHFDPAPLFRSRYLDNLAALRLCGEDDNGHLDIEGVRALVSSKHLGKLVELDLSGNWLHQFDPDTLAVFLGATNLPSLRVLRLARIGLRNADAQLLAATPWLDQLKILDLRLNNIGGAGVEALGGSPHLAGLEELDIRDNIPHMEGLIAYASLSSGYAAELRARFAPRLRL